MDYFDILSDLHRILGNMMAKLNWSLCNNLDDHDDVRSFRRNVTALRTRTDFLLSSSEDFLDEQALGSLNAMLEEERERAETVIEREHRPADLFFNRKALVICTERLIPEDIQIGLSFGYKFLFPYSCNDDNLHRLLAQLEMTIEQAVPVLSGLRASVDIQRILKGRSFSRDFNDTLSWLKFVSKRTASFFEANLDVIAIRTDKGGHTAVLNLVDYNAKLWQHLSDDVYINIQIDPLVFLVAKEVELVDQLFEIPSVKAISSGLAFQPNILSLAKFYGLPKIHKPNIPLRPITSTVNSPGFFLGKLFYRMLDIVFPRSTFHIKDSYDFVEFINSATIETNDILVSFDVVSMYTSIPFEMVFDMVMHRSDEFLVRFGIDRALLSNILIFLLEECSVFTVLDNVFKQKDGLPMGSCLSPLIARIFMDEVITVLLRKVPVSFIKVFVDDTIAAINFNQVDQALAVLNGFAPGQVRFTLEREDDRCSINFLNVTLIREGNAIVTNWYRKHFASGRLLNFYSSHKRATVVATAAHFIKTVLFLSDPRFFHGNRGVIERTLRENSFPEIVIITLMNTFYTYMKPVNRECFSDEVDKRYVIFPHAIAESKRIKRVIYDLKGPEVSLADSVKNTTINFVKSIKMIDPIAAGGNVVLSSTCKCASKCVIGATRFNESGRMARKRLLTRKNRCDSDGHSFRTFEVKKGLYYNHQTQYLLRYMQWLHRHKLDVTSCPYHFPLYNFCRLIKCKCCN